MVSWRQTHCLRVWYRKAEIYVMDTDQNRTDNPAQIAFVSVEEGNRQDHLRDECRWGSNRRTKSSTTLL